VDLDSSIDEAPPEKDKVEKTASKDVDAIKESKKSVESMEVVSVEGIIPAVKNLKEDEEISQREAYTSPSDGVVEDPSAEEKNDGSIEIMEVAQEDKETPNLDPLQQSVESGDVTSSAEAMDETATSDLASEVDVIELNDDDDDDDELEIILDESGSTSSRSLRSGTKVHRPVGQSFRAGEKCPTCRQRLAEVRRFSPGEEGAAGPEQVITDPAVNICMDGGQEDDGQPLQFKLTDFTVYDAVSGPEFHLVPIFAESLLSRNVKLYLAGRVRRIDSEETEPGLRVVGIGPITQWNNATGVEGGENNVIITHCTALHCTGPEKPGRGGGHDFT
jgi:hypothetical protein